MPPRPTDTCASTTARALREDTRLASDCSDSQIRCRLPPALSSAGDEMTVPNHKRDPEIHQDVRAELSMHQQDDGKRSVEITVHRGVVYLTGLVESYAQKWAIDRAVRRIIGVKDLQDYLHVRPPEGAAPDDRRIARVANRALRWDVRVPKGIRAKVSNGVLRLSGAVQRFWQREAAEEAVRNLMGVRDIVNEIALLPACPAGPSHPAGGGGAPAVARPRFRGSSRSRPRRAW